jgi:hypothetical protein
MNNITWLDNIFLYFKKNPAATIIQVITTIPYSMAFWREKKKNVLIWVAISCSLFAIGYFILSAYSGIIIAVGTFIATIIGIWFGKKRQAILKTRLIVFFLLIIVTIITSLLIEKNAIMWLVLTAGFLDYFAYLVFREYSKTMHIVLILSQLSLVIYEIIFLLYLFALLDLITMLVIFVHLTKLFTRQNAEIINLRRTNQCPKSY